VSEIEQIKYIMSLTKHNAKVTIFIERETYFKRKLLKFSSFRVFLSKSGDETG
jgi:hypothetical protein